MLYEKPNQDWLKGVAIEDYYPCDFSKNTLQKFLGKGDFEYPFFLRILFLNLRFLLRFN